MTTTATYPHARRGAPVRPWWGEAALAAAWLTMVIVVGLWVANRGFQAMTDAAGVLNSLGRLTGLVAADLLLIQVLLMARIPLVERVFGQDALARRHRLVGFTSFWLMVAHVVLITIGYAEAARVPLLDQLWQLVTEYPGMLLATAGTVALVVVVGLSIRAARRRLRYESWHLIHLYAYLGVGLALPHQLWTGTDFTASPVATVYWWTLYALALLAVLVYRIGLPLWRSHRHRLRVTSVVRESPDVVSVHLGGRALGRLPVRAGQFFLWRFLDGPGWSRAHPYSLSAAPGGDSLRITVKDLGDGSARVAGLAPGTRVLVEGPYGAVTSARRTSRQVLLVAAGVGITAVRGLLEELPFAPGELTLLYRVRHRRDAVFARELDWFVANRGLRLIYLEGNRAKDSWLPVGFAATDGAEALRRLVPEIAEHDAFLCGPPRFMSAVRDSLRRCGVPAERIHAEEFAW
ncbi:oxidoreductase [Solihabitans fulvus]|uniref:Oxidoreductase n=1 Tax=Solihabitans fulvus TaxID=1892852 RepID=A0A5B2XF21_9PSEU|nr:ferredoxin reductase family protein [Solihabitans fulvus]KAA2261669.1 oxidoreductase [Solihabitans fulvus]